MPPSELQPYRVDIVLVTSGHSPSLLNADFLLRKDIVKEEWNWQLADDVVTTPVHSQVKYASDFTIIAQGNRVIFSESDPDRIPSSSRVGEIAAAYVQTVSPLTCTAVGINPKACLPFDEREEARAYIAQRFLKEGPLLDHWPVQLNAVKVAYDVGEARLLMSVDTGKVRTVQEEVLFGGVLFQGNFHYDLSDSQEENQEPVTQIIGQWREDCETFIAFLRDTLLG